MTRKSRFLATTGLSIIDQRMVAARTRYGKPMRDPDGHAAPAPTPTPAPEPTSFDDAFAAAAAEGGDGGGGGAAPAGDAPAGQEPGAGAASAGGAPATGGEGAAPGAEATPPAGDGAVPPAGGQTPASGAEGAPPAAAPPAAAAPAGSADDIVAGLTNFLKEQVAAKPGAPAAGTPPADAQDPPIYTDAEQAVLTDFEKNWPDVAQAGRLERRAEYNDLLKFVFTQVQTVLGPIQDQLRTVGNTMHLGEVKALVPDYTDTLEADVSAWVDTQPTYLQAAYKQVMQQGTSEEVADLIGRYRAANPAAAPAPAAPAAPAAAAPAAAAPKTELSEAAKQAATSLAPVGGDRSHVPQGEDSGDFDTAFARHAAAMDG